MKTSLRVIAEKAVHYKENIEFTIAKARNIYPLRVPILMYHHIGNPKDNKDNLKLYVNPNLFEAEMKYLADNNYFSITLDDLTDTLTRRTTLSPKPIILTFDDGNWDFYTNVFPILEKYKLKATVFVITGFLDKHNYLSINMLKTLLKSELVTIGSHTVSHPNLTKLSQREVDYELKKSKEDLEKKVGRKLNSFAYPLGKYNKTVISEVQKTGYSNAVSTNYGSLHLINNLFNLKRIRIGRNLTLPDFERRINVFDSLHK